MLQRLSLPLRWVARLLLVVLVAVGVPALTTAPAAFACSCAPSDITERTERSEAVFVGTMEPGSLQDDPDSFGGHTFRIEVGTVFRGDVPTVATVFSANSSSACGLDPIPSGNLIWFAYAAASDDADLQVSMCFMPEPASEQNLKQVMDAVAALKPTPNVKSNEVNQQTSATPREADAQRASNDDSSTAESWGIAVAALLGAVVLIVVGLRVRRRVNTPQP